MNIVTSKPNSLQDALDDQQEGDSKYPLIKQLKFKMEGMKGILNVVRLVVIKLNENITHLLNLLQDVIKR